MLNKIQEISWSNVIELFSTFGQSLVKLNHSAVNTHDGMNDNLMASIVFFNLDLERLHDWIDDHCKFFGDLNQSFFRPISEPIDHTSVEQCRWGSCSVWEIWIVGIHRENNVKVSLDVLDERLVNLVVWWAAFGVAFLKLRQQKHVFFTFEETRDLARCKEGVHLFQEGRRKTVGFIKDEADLLLLDTWSFHNSSEIFIEICDSVIPSSLNLEDWNVVHPGNEPTQSGLTDTTCSYQQAMSQRLSQDSVNSQNVFEDFVEYDDWHIELFFVENLESGLDVSLEFILVNWHVVLR